MYKFLLCWRYLRTRYIALASVISVMLGVATMIVVNSVMAGFTHEMQNRIHGILSDVVVESHSLEGFHDPEWHMQRIRQVAGKYVEGMTPTVVVPAMLNFQVRGQWITRPVSLIGVEEATHGKVSDFANFLQHPENRKNLSFKLRDGGYDVDDHQARPGAHGPQRTDLQNAGWPLRRYQAAQAKRFAEFMATRSPGDPVASATPSNAAPTIEPPSEESPAPVDASAPEKNSETAPSDDPDSKPESREQQIFGDAPPAEPAASPALAPDANAATEPSSIEPATSRPDEEIAQGERPPLEDPFRARNPFGAESQNVFDPARTTHRHRARHQLGQLSHFRGPRSVHGAAGPRCEAHLAHGRHSAQGRDRQFHDH